MQFSVTHISDRSDLSKEAIYYQALSVQESEETINHLLAQRQNHQNGPNTRSRRLVRRPDRHRSGRMAKVLTMIDNNHALLALAADRYIRWCRRYGVAYEPPSNDYSYVRMVNAYQGYVVLKNAKGRLAAYICDHGKLGAKVKESLCSRLDIID